MSSNNPPAKPSPDTPERQLARHERLVRFALELAASLRHDFHYYWTMPERRTQVPQGQVLMHRIEHLRATASRQLRHLEASRGLPPVQALARLKELNPQELFDASQGLDQLARELRDLGRQRGWGSHATDGPSPIANHLRALVTPLQPKAPPPPPAAPNTLTDRLKGWLKSTEPAPAAAPAPTAPSVGTRRLAAFDTSLDLLQNLHKSLQAPMAALHAARTRQPAPPSLPQELADKLPQVTAELAAQPALLRAADVALHQFRQITEQLPVLKKASAEAHRVSPDHVGGVLQGHDLAKLKGVMLPLTNLHVTFRAYPATASLFPTPERVEIQTALPAKEEAPLALPQKPQPAPDESKEVTMAAVMAAAETHVEKRHWREANNERSRKRLALLMGYMRNPQDRSVFKDEETVLRLVGEETTYQTDRETDLRMRLRLMNDRPDAPALADQRQKLAQELNESRTILANLTQLSKFVTNQRAARSP